MTALKDNRHDDEKGEREKWRNMNKERKRDDIISRYVIPYCINLSLNSVSLPTRAREREGDKSSVRSDQISYVLGTQPLPPIHSSNGEGNYLSFTLCVCVLLFHFQLRDNEKEPWETRGEEEEKKRRRRREEEEKEEAVKSFIHDKVNAGGDIKKEEERNSGETRRSKISRNVKHRYLRGSSYTRVKRT